MRRALTIAASVFLVTAAAGAAIAADMPVKARPYHAPPPIGSNWQFEVGARYWYSSATNRYDYFAGPSDAERVSRLSYDGLSAHSGEAFFRFDSPYQIFAKGYIGGGKITRGTLYDEDYPPGTVPYSKTQSDADGHLSYVTGDLGYTVFDGRVTNGPAIRVGAFAGVHYWREKATGRGCVQIGGGNVCDPGNEIANSVAVISEEDKWTSLRLGGVADIWFTPELKLTIDAAYARVSQKALDIHFFTLGPTPSSGKGHGFELEGILSYQLTRTFNVGVGGRWWHYETKLFDPNNQMLRYKTDRFGAFVQGSLTFN